MLPRKNQGQKPAWDSDWRLSRHWALWHDLSEIPVRKHNEIAFLCGYVNGGRQKIRFVSVSPLQTWVKAFRFRSSTYRKQSGHK